MTFQTIDEFNVTGIEGLFLYAAEVVPIFIPLLLLAIFMITMLGTFFSQKRLTGSSDFLSSMTVASWITTIAAFILSLNEGLINITTISVAVAITAITTILLLVSDDKFA